MRERAIPGRPGGAGHRGGGPRAWDAAADKGTSPSPPLGAHEAKGPEAIAPVKFFTPDNSWTWYATSYSPEDGTFFGLVDGQFKELGYFTLAELETARGPLGMPIERDLHWQPRTLREIAPELFSGG